MSHYIIANIVRSKDLTHFCLRFHANFRKNKGFVHIKDLYKIGDCENSEIVALNINKKLFSKAWNEMLIACGYKNANHRENLLKNFENRYEQIVASLSEVKTSADKIEIVKKRKLNDANEAEKEIKTLGANQAIEKVTVKKRKLDEANEEERENKKLRPNLPNEKVIVFGTASLRINNIEMAHAGVRSYTLQIKKITGQEERKLFKKTKMTIIK